MPHPHDQCPIPPPADRSHVVHQLHKGFVIPSRQSLGSSDKRINRVSSAEREVLARAIIPALRESNPRFDSGRFMAAAVGGGRLYGFTKH